MLFIIKDFDNCNGSLIARISACFAVPVFKRFLKHEFKPTLKTRSLKNFKNRHKLGILLPDSLLSKGSKLHVYTPSF